MSDLTHITALWRAGRRAEAEHALVGILRSDPEDAVALQWLAELYGSSGRAHEAVGAWRRLCAVRVHDAAARRSLAQALLATQAVSEAIDVLHTAIELEPGNARAYNNLGLAQLRSGDAAAAVSSIERALALDSGYAIAQLNLGLAREHQGDHAGALSSYRRALELEPHLTQARLQLSRLLAVADAATARAEGDRAIESHAINLMTQRRHEEALAVWTELLERGSNLPRLAGMRFHCQLFCCDWTEYAPRAAALETAARAGADADLPFNFFVYSHSPAAQLACARTYAQCMHREAVAGTIAEAAASRAGAPDVRHDRLKIAYLSFDFHEHATAYLLAGLLEAHDRKRFEVTALSFGENDRSAMRARLEAAVEHFVDVRALSDADVAAWLRDRGIHIAVDLKGYTGGARPGIFVRRGAPLQINFLGFPGTLGADCIDYIVADRHVIPEADERHYAEQVILMPGCYQPNDAHRPRPASAPPRGALGLPDSGFVWCSFNNLYKITPEIFRVWLELLRDVPDSVLWLLEGTPAAMRNLRAYASAAGIAPQRLVFAPHRPLAEHLGRYRHADLFLDSLPCNAHTTASDALWMGVPVLTVTGRTFAGRVATSLLNAVGLPDLCMGSVAEYAAMARRLATQPDSLRALRARLDAAREGSSLFDSRLYARHLEQAYAAIWARHAAGAAPARLMVADLPA